jgi:hypothetical protein
VHVRTVQVFSFGKGRPIDSSLGPLSHLSFPTEGGGEDSVMATAIATATSIAVAPLTAVGMVEIPVEKIRIHNIYSRSETDRIMVKPIKTLHYFTPFLKTVEMGESPTCGAT